MRAASSASSLASRVAQPSSARRPLLSLPSLRRFLGAFLACTTSDRELVFTALVLCPVARLPQSGSESTDPPRGGRGGRAGVAQLAEHLFCKQAVRGSSPLASSKSESSRSSLLLFILRLVLRRRRRLEDWAPEGCPSGQREQTVNLPAMPSVVRIHHPPLRRARRISLKNEVTATHAGVAQLVERQPSKLNVAGSNPVSRSRETEKTQQVRFSLASPT